jgi:hypothetical protein
MGTSSFGVVQLLDLPGSCHSVAPVHHRGYANFYIYIQLVLLHSESNISGHFCGIAANYHTRSMSDAGRR